MYLAKLKMVSLFKKSYVYLAGGFLGCLVLLIPGEALAVDTGERIRMAIEESIEESIEEKVAGSSEWERVEVSGVRLKPGLNFPEDSIVEVTGALASKPLGRRTFQMLARFGDNEITFRARAVVKAYRRVFYLNRSLSKGQPVSESDIVGQEMDVSRIPKDAVSDPSELVDGLVASRSIGVNVLLKLSYFKEVPAARKGSRVLLVADNGPVKVVVPGVLKEDAYKGRAVRVMNIMSRKEVVGWLVNAGTVEIIF